MRVRLAPLFLAFLATGPAGTGASAEERSKLPKDTFGGLSVLSGVRGGATDDGDGFVAPSATVRLWGLDASHEIIARPELALTLVVRDAAALMGDLQREEIPQGTIEFGFLLGWRDRSHGPCGFQLGAGIADGEFVLRRGDNNEAAEAEFPPGRFDILRGEPGLFCQWRRAALQISPYGALGFKIAGQQLTSTGAVGSYLRLYVRDGFRARVGVDWEKSIGREPSVNIATATAAFEGEIAETKHFDVVLGASAKVSDRKAGGEAGAAPFRSQAVTFGVDAGIAF